MINVPTVLVLGAGASVPYGFPSAEELKRLICGAFDIQTNPHPAQFLADRYDYSLEQFAEFREALSKSGKTSVDEFLEHRKEFVDVGKLAIAYCLIPYENENNLFLTEARRGGDWYQYLFNKLNAPFHEFAGNQLSVVTFNYDRSLEHYLLTTLQNAYGRSYEECAELVAKIPIVHVYGQLSRVPYPKPDSRPYYPKAELSMSAGNAAQGIKILHDADPKFEEAHKLLIQAKTICFLGFSYHPVNVQRLALRGALSQGIVFGSALGLVDSEMSDIAGRLRQLLSNNVTLDRADNLLTLRQYRVLG
jgi:hypothetical protein